MIRTSANVMLCLEFDAMQFVIFLALFGLSLGQWDPNFAPDRAGLVHLFEWHWDTIGEECEIFLGPNKFGGIQISPPNENVIINQPSRPWWERYQSVSYKLETRSGNRQQFQNMVDRCNRAGVRIYPDVVINHMAAASLGPGKGTGGSSYNTFTEDYPAVPYNKSDFNDNRCTSSSGGLDNWNDVNQLRNCQLLTLQDLNMGKDYVRGKIINYLNDLISLGVAGFRVDAGNHMWPGDLKVILDSLNDLPTDKGFAAGTRPYVFFEVIARPNGYPINANDYYPIGSLTEFQYGLEINKNRNKIQYLRNIGESWGLYPSNNAVPFLNNHDNQRSNNDYIDFEQFYDLKIFSAFMMAWPYGIPRIMSSYRYTHSDDGPPPMQRSVNADGSCGNNWVCEHRWRQIKNMAAFAVAAKGQPMLNWWTNNDNQIAFSRGDKAFLAINKANTELNQVLQVGLPEGHYCDVIAGELTNGKCTSTCVYVDASSKATIKIPTSTDPMIALHVNAKCDCTKSKCQTTPKTNCVSCNQCSKKVDCGSLATDQAGCERKGCLWCPAAQGSNDPWCIQSSEITRKSLCDVMESLRTDCGYHGIDASKCNLRGCCWKESKVQGVPWCFAAL